MPQILTIIPWLWIYWKVPLPHTHTQKGKQNCVSDVSKFKSGEGGFLAQCCGNALLWPKSDDSKKSLVLFYLFTLCAGWSKLDFAERDKCKPEAEFLDVIGKKNLTRFPPCYSQFPLLTDFTPRPPPLSRSGLKLVCNVNIVYGNIKSENSQDYAQKPQRNCAFMNLAPVLETLD